MVSVVETSYKTAAVSYLLDVFVPLEFVIQDYSEVSDIFSVV